MSAEVKFQAVVKRLRQVDGVVVAFSGGVDSSVLLAAAQEAQGPRALAVIGRSPSFPGREYEEAVKVAEGMGARYRTLDTDEIENPEYAANPTHRCFICKSTLFKALQAVALEEGLELVLEGSNEDDRQDYRPGMKAATLLGVLAPLQEEGLSKDEIRELARTRGLPVWDKPSLACLASRIPYGSTITRERLGRIDQAEELIRAHGFRQVRVRDHGEIARIELEAEGVARLMSDELRAQVVHELKELGFSYVALDLQGYRTGAMNEALGLSAS